MAFSLNYTTAWERFSEWYRGSWVDRAFTFLLERVFVVPFAEYEKIPLSPGAGVVARNLILSFLVAFWIAAVTMAYVKSVPGGFIRRLLSMGAVDEEHAVTLAEAGYRRSAAVRRDLTRGGVLAKLLCRVGDGKRTVFGAAISAEESNATPTKPNESEPAQPAALPAAVPPSENGSAETTSTSEKDVPVQSECPVEKDDAAQAEPKESAIENSAENAEPAEESDAAQAEPKESEPALPVDFEKDRFYIPEELRIRAELRFARRGSGLLSVVLSVVISTLAAFLLCNLLPVLFGLANRMLGG